MTGYNSVPYVRIADTQVGNNASSPPTGIQVHFKGRLMIYVPGERVSIDDMLTRMLGEFRARD